MLVSFKSHRISTTANTTIAPAVIVGARLVAATSAAITVHLHDAGVGGTTSASTRVASLATKALNGVDEVGYPLRIGGQSLVVTPTGTSATLYVFVR